MPTTEQLKRQLLELSILTLVTIIIWIGYGVYTALNHPSESLVRKEELRDVPTNLDLEQIGSLRERLVITEEMLNLLDSRSRSLISVETASAASPSSQPVPASPSASFNVSLPASPSTGAF